MADEDTLAEDIWAGGGGVKRGAEFAHVGTAALGCPPGHGPGLEIVWKLSSEARPDSRGRLSPHGLCLNMVFEVAVESVLSG